MAGERLEDEVDTVIIQKLKPLVNPTIERHAHCPRASEDVFVLECHFVIDVMLAGWRVAFNDAQRIAMEVSGGVKPGATIEMGRIDDERVAIPMAP